MFVSRRGIFYQNSKSIVGWATANDERMSRVVVALMVKTFSRFKFNKFRKSESLPLYQYQLNSLDFVINRFFMKLFKTTNMYTIATLQEMFGFELPSVRIARRTVKFISKFNEGNCVLVKVILVIS